MILGKFIQKLTIIILVNFLFVSSVFAQGLETLKKTDKPVLSGNGYEDDDNYEKLKEEVRKPPPEIPKEKRLERPADVNPDKPVICGEIIFDITQKEQPITLKESLEIALEKNFDIKIVSQRAERDRWRYYQSVTNWLPDITYDARVSRINGQFLVGNILIEEEAETAVESNFRMDLTASIRKYFDLRTARYEYEAQKKQLDFSKDEILKETATKYYELLTAKKNIEILETNMVQVKEQLRINQAKFEAGIGTRFDVSRAEADIARAEQELILAKNQYRFNQSQLANLIGIPVFVQLVPENVDIKVKEIFKDCFDISKAKELADQCRDDLNAAKFDIKAANQRKNAGYSDYIPDLSFRMLVAQQGLAGGNLLPARNVGLFLEWGGGRSLGLKGYTEVKARKAQLEETRLEYIRRQRSIEEDIVRTFFNTIAARELIDATWEELKAATESRNLAVVRLRTGIGTFIDVLQAQNQYTTANINHIRAVLGYNISQIDLLFSMGVISVNNIISGFESTPNMSKTTK